MIVTERVNQRLPQPIQKTTAQWTSILHLAAKWEFENIKLLAIDNLTTHAAPIDKIVLGRRYGITEWLPSAYEAVCTRADPLTLEEGMKLGIEDTVRISTARQVYGISSKRYEVKYLAGDLGEIFGLGKPEDNGIVTENEEDAIKVLETKIAQAQNKYQADAPPIAGTCTNPVYTGNGAGTHSYHYDKCGSCGGCKPKSAKQREAREAKEEQERQLVDLKLKFKNKWQEMQGRQERMSSFR